MSLDYTPGTEPEPVTNFDWHHADLFNNPPYDSKDMVQLLTDGKFIIEGRASNFHDAITFAEDYAPDQHAAFKAINALSDQMGLHDLVY